MQDDLNPKFPPLPVAAKDMTLRDYFAAAALPGIMSSLEQWARHLNYNSIGSEVLAKLAYDTADAMLKEREK